MRGNTIICLSEADLITIAKLFIIIDNEINEYEVSIQINTQIKK